MKITVYENGKVYVFTQPGNNNGTLIILAEPDYDSSIVGCRFYYLAYTLDNFTNNNELIDHINQTKATYDELFSETYIDE